MTKANTGAQAGHEPCATGIAGGPPGGDAQTTAVDEGTATAVLGAPIGDSGASAP